MDWLADPQAWDAPSPELQRAQERRSQFLLALKHFELGELSSGQAAEMCGLSRPGFLLEAGRHGVSVAELDPEELETEFAHS